MDYVGPPGGFEKLFAQYDNIVAHHAHMQDEEQPPPISVHPTSVEPTPIHDEPPWAAPVDVGYVPSPGFSPAERAEQALKKNLGYDPSKSWRDIDAERAENAEKLMNERLKNPKGATFQQDEEGLVKAYNDETAPGVFYDPTTKTEYIKGSVTARDWWDDASKIPFWGDTRNAERYQQADKAYEDLLLQGKPVDRVVGHSLGGSVALQMQKDRFIPKSRTFGAPVVDLNPFGKSERYRHPLDPVSILDRGATWGKFKPYSHSYTGFDNLQAS